MEKELNSQIKEIMTIGVSNVLIQVVNDMYTAISSRYLPPQDYLNLMFFQFNHQIHNILTSKLNTMIKDFVDVISKIIK